MALPWTGAVQHWGRGILRAQWMVMKQDPHPQMHRVQSCVVSHLCSVCDTTSLCHNAVLSVTIVTVENLSLANRETDRQTEVVFNPVFVHNKRIQSRQISLLSSLPTFPLCGVR